MDDTRAEPSFDALLAELQDVVDKLETGNLGLEDSLKTFEKGVTLAKKGHALLDGAEKRVEMLIRGEDGGDARAPLPDSE